MGRRICADQVCRGSTVTTITPHPEAALEDSLLFIYELWVALGEVFTISREDLL